MAKSKRSKARKVLPVEIKNDYEEEIISRIGECERVIGEIDGSGLWKIVIRDTEELRKTIDNTWHEITDDSQLQKARVIKFATLHILSLKERYQEEMKSKQKELRAIQNPDKIIHKDYDLE